MTLEPAFQYSSGRKSSRCPTRTQCRPPPARCWGDRDVRLHAPQSLIALSNVNDTGIPTPTVVPPSGVYVPMKLLAEEVVKTESAAAVRPSVSFAVPP